MNIKEKVKSAAQWSVLDKILKRFVTFIVSIFLARILEPADFGLVAMYSVFLTIASAFLDMGMGQALVQKKEVSHIQYNSIFFISLALGLLFYAVFWFAAPFISAFYEIEKITSIVRVSSITFIIHGLMIVHSTIIYKTLEIKVFTKAMVISTVLSGIVGITLAVKGFGVWSLVFQGIVGSLTNGIVLFYHSTWRPNLEFKFSEVKDLWKSGLKFMNIGIINSVVDRLDSLVIGKYFSAADLGLMNRAKTFPEMPQTTLILPLTRPLFPYFADIQDDLIQVKQVFFKSVDFLGFVAILFFGLIYLSAENLIVIIYTDKWMASVPYLKILVWLLPIVPVGAVTTALLKGLGRLKLLTVTTLVERGAIIASLVISVYYGLMYYLYALVILKALSLIMRMLLIRKYVGIDIVYIFKSIVPVFLISLVSIRLVMFVQLSNPYLDVIVNSLLYLILLFTASFLFKVEGFALARTELWSFLNRKKIK